MCQFVETIRIKDGEPCHLQYHLHRLNLTRSNFWPNSKEITEEQLLPETPMARGLQKARILYDKSGILSREFTPYHARSIKSLAIVCNDNINYTWKSTDRSMLTNLRAKAPKADDIIIVKNNCITDTSYTNICFYDGRRWLTPDTPLLKGVMRQYLLNQQLIKEAHIQLTDIHSFEKISLVNAMLNLGDIVLPIESITAPLPCNAEKNNITY